MGLIVRNYEFYSWDSICCHFDRFHCLSSSYNRSSLKPLHGATLHSNHLQRILPHNSFSRPLIRPLQLQTPPLPIPAFITLFQRHRNRIRLRSPRPELRPQTVYIPELVCCQRWDGPWSTSIWICGPEFVFCGERVY